MASQSLSVFSFDSFPVRTVIVNDEPWFVASDVARALSYSHVPHMPRFLDDDEKGVHVLDTLGGKQDVTIINESGLYSLILRSRQPEAKRFKRWVTHEVLPAIRRTGQYSAADSAFSDDELSSLFVVLGAAIHGYEEWRKMREGLRVLKVPGFGNVNEHLMVAQFYAQSLLKRHRGEFIAARRRQGITNDSPAAQQH